MAKHRSNRLAESLKQEISQMIREELKDPRIGFATVTSIEVADDLSHAKVYVSVLGDAQKAQETIDALKGATGFVRTEIGKRIRLRHVPEIVFKYDNSIEYGAHITRLLRDVQGEGQDEGESDDE
ncbi:MAG: 30S ribosome-binding factor RbfA [Desulfitobacterium sp.]|nr:30S ribosome-binding factor RbfA [Desulfitobacterium sp.]